MASSSPRTRLFLLLLLSATLLFAGLWLREKRLGVMAGAAASSGPGSPPGANPGNAPAAVQAQLKSWQSLAWERQQEMQRANEFVGMMADPRTSRFVLSGERGRGQAFVDSTRGRLALFTFELPEVTAPAAYQAWGRTAAGDAQSLGMLPAPLEGVRTLLVPTRAGELRAIEVTLEDRPGGAAPSGPVVLRGEASATAP